jgi:hypothetical protein
MFDRKEKMNGRGLDTHTQIMHECIFESFALLPLPPPKRKARSNKYVILSLYRSPFVLFFFMDGSGADSQKFQINPPKYILFWLFRLLLFVVVGFSLQKARINKKRNKRNHML